MNNLSVQLRQLLFRYWGHDHFRPLQEEIIASIIQRKDTLALLPTGGGKSICFQVPALYMDGLCLVVSPLIALMKDQVERLNSKGIKAYSIISGMNRSEIDLALDHCINGGVKFLYVSPERLASDAFRERLNYMKISMLAVDEAHCISQWGYDFRPSYLRVAEIRELLPKVPVLALTATATPVVQQDIQDKLHFKNPLLLKSSFERTNLGYVVLKDSDKSDRMLKVIQGAGGTGIVYVRNRKRAKELSEWLILKKVTASFYHAGLTMDERSGIQSAWMSGKNKVIVATNAFGMGIDKSDVRFVIHYDLPESPEAYFQEAGRAGRDGKKSWAVILYGSSDKEELERRAEVEFPSLTLIKQVYTAIGNYLNIPVGSGKGNAFDFDVAHFGSTFNFSTQTVMSVIRILSLEGLLELSDAPAFHSRLHFTIHPERLYEFQVKNKSHDVFIKSLLRSYEGLFDDYVVIREREIAQRTALPLQEVIKKIKNLHQLQILDYRPAKDEPQLTFTIERQDARYLQIDKAALEQRKEWFIRRANTMIYYADELNDCRSRYLLQYFGENLPARCGTCDNCLAKNKLLLSDVEFEVTADKIKKRLTESSCSIEELMQLMHPMEPEQVFKVIDWLLDHAKITYLGTDKLQWMADN